MSYILRIQYFLILLDQLAYFPQLAWDLFILLCYHHLCWLVWKSKTLGHNFFFSHCYKQNVPPQHINIKSMVKRVSQIMIKTKFIQLTCPCVGHYIMGFPNNKEYGILTYSYSRKCIINILQSCFWSTLLFQKLQENPDNIYWGTLQTYCYSAGRLTHSPCTFDDILNDNIKCECPLQLISCILMGH